MHWSIELPDHGVCLQAVDYATEWQKVLKEVLKMNNIDTINSRSIYAAPQIDSLEDSLPESILKEILLEQ